jgi:O-antigen/teichoic acid export membrane protein
MMQVFKKLYQRYNDSEGLRKISQNIGWLFFDKFIRLGVGLVVGVWVARYLGPEQYGTLNYALAFVGIFSALGSMGIEGIVVRDIVQKPEKKYEILSSAFILKLSGGIIAFIILFITIIYVRPSDNQSHWLVGIIGMIMVFQAFDAIDL